MGLASRVEEGRHHPHLLGGAASQFVLFSADYWHVQAPAALCLAAF